MSSIAERAPERRICSFGACCEQDTYECGTPIDGTSRNFCKNIVANRTTTLRNHRRRYTCRLLQRRCRPNHPKVVRVSSRRGEVTRVHVKRRLDIRHLKTILIQMLPKGGSIGFRKVLPKCMYDTFSLPLLEQWNGAPLVPAQSSHNDANAS